jgi:phosphoglycerol transferase
MANLFRKAQAWTNAVIQEAAYGCPKSRTTRGPGDRASRQAGKALSRAIGLPLAGSTHHRRIEVPRTLIAAMLVIVTTSVLIRNLAVDSPVMGGDEYAYFAEAQTFPDSAQRHINDPYLQAIYSPVFAAYGRMLFSLSDRPELLLKALNTLCFALTTLLFLRLLKSFRGTDASPVSAAVFLLLPISAYTAYFMPESIYALFFALLTWCMVAVLPVHLLAGSILSGAVVGAMLLVKPHAVALFLAVTLTLSALFLAPSAFRPGRRKVFVAIALYILSTYLTLVCVNALLTGRFQLHPLAFVGGIYQPYLSRGASLASWSDGASQILGILSGHLIVFGAMLAPTLSLGVSRLRGLYVNQQAPAVTEPVRSRRLFVLICLAALSTLLTMGMTANFTSQVAQASPGESLRLLARYYSFVLPLHLLLYFGCNTEDPRSPASDTWIRVGALGGCVAAALLYYLLGTRLIYPWDYPEAFVFSSWHGHPRVALAGIVTAVTSYALILWRGRPALMLYPLSLLIIFSLSNVEVTLWQRASTGLYATLRASARAMKQLIPPDERDQGLVVGSDRYGRMAYFLFNFGSSARVLVRDTGSVLTDADIPAGTQWVLLTDWYRDTFRATASLRTQYIAFIRVDAGEPVIHESVSDWSGSPLHYSFASGANIGMLEGFHPPEPSGAWSAVCGAKIVLPVRVEGNVTVSLDAWTTSSRLSQKLIVGFGDLRAEVPLAATRSIAEVDFDLKAPTRELVLVGLVPVREQPWLPPLGVAVAGIELRRRTPAVGGKGRPVLRVAVPSSTVSVTEECRR